MANSNVIESLYFSKPYDHFSKSHTYTANRSAIHRHNVREPKPEYNDDLTAKLAALLKMPAWPQFPDGAYLNSQQATRLYQIAHGIQGLIHILNRSTYLQGLARDYNEPNQQLNEYQQSQLWAGLIELGTELVEAVDEAHQRAQKNP
jgi:hypothetical protein